MVAGLAYGGQSMLMSSLVNGWQITAAADGTDWGNPEQTVAKVASMLMDGDRMIVTRFGNREATIKLRVYGTSMDAVALGEAALQAEVNKGQNTMTWTPPGVSTPSVFDVVYGDLQFSFDSYSEAGLTMRTFTLKLVCAPFARRATATVTVSVPVPAGAPVVTSIDACTSATGWSSPNGTPTVVGAAYVTVNTANDAVQTRLTKTGMAAAVAVGEYVVVEFGMDTLVTGSGAEPRFYYDTGFTVSAAILAMVPVSGGGLPDRWQAYLPRPASGTLSVLAMRDEGAAPYTAYISCFDISKSTQLPVTGSARQRLMSLAVGGTARTAADLALEVSAAGSGTLCTALDEAILFSYRSSEALYPPIRTFLTSSGAVAGGGVIWTSKLNFASPAVFTIPASAIPPGEYLLVGRFNHNGPGSTTDTVTWVATTTGNRTNTGLDQSGSATFLTNSSSNFIHVDMGVVTLPTVAVGAASAANVVLTITGTGNIAWEEFWLFHLTKGALTRVKDTTSATRLLVSSAAILGNDNPSTKLGTKGTTADDVDAGDRIVSPGVHEFNPGVMNVLLVTPGTLTQQLTSTQFDRFKHNVTAP